MLPLHGGHGCKGDGWKKGTRGQQNSITSFPDRNLKSTLPSWGGALAHQAAHGGPGADIPSSRMNQQTVINGKSLYISEGSQARWLQRDGPSQWEALM